MSSELSISQYSLAFHAPLTKRIERLIGVFAGTTSIRDPLAGKVILSSEEIDMKQLKELLGEENLIIVTADHLLSDNISSLI